MEEVQNTTAKGTITITCPHCKKEIETDKLEEIDCDRCGETKLSIQTKKCKNPECETFFCIDSCAEDSLDEAGYCEECGVIACDGCGADDVPKDETTRCGKCGKTNFCEECKTTAFAEDGSCIECSNEKVFECSEYSCERKLILSKGIRCANFEACQSVFCTEHRKEISGKGYCDDCATFECPGCSKKFDATDAIQCTNEKCRSGLRVCVRCRPTYMDMQGRCTSCTTDRVVSCARCGNEVLFGTTYECANCKKHYCGAHLEGIISCAKCHKSVCSDCGSRCKECKRPYCHACVKFKGGRCKEHGLSLFDRVAKLFD